MISNSDIRTIKKAVADVLATVPGIGEIIPARMVFPSKAAYFNAIASLTSQKAIETQPAAFAMVSLAVPRVRVDELNEKIFGMVFSVQCFREAFDTRIDETTTPDAFNKKLIASEDLFDAALVNLGYAFREDLNVAGLSPELSAVITAFTSEPQIEFGEPPYFPGVIGNYAEATINIEVIYDDC